MTSTSLAGRAIVLAAVVIAYLSTFAPSRYVLGLGLRALNYPKYEGFWGAFVPHALLYSTLTAIVCALLWYALWRMRLLPAPALATNLPVHVWGIVAGIAALAVSLIVIAIAFPPGTIHWIPPQWWKIAGNFFSNGYEEFIFRGFMLAALTVVFGFWPAAVLSSAMWGAEHTQYPIVLRVLIASIGTFWCWIVRKTKSMIAAYEAHMVLDIIGDCLIP